MRKMMILLLSACIGLAGSATQAGLFSATATVIAIMAGELFVGEAEGDLSGAGRIAIHAQADTDLTCRGQFTSSDEQGGFGELVCSDGASATFRFQRLGIWRGYGDGNFSRGAMSFAYGFGADEVGPYVKLPQGKRLAHYGEELRLVDL